MRNRLRSDSLFLKKNVNQLQSMLEYKNQEIRIMETQEKKNRTKLYVTRNNL